MLRTNRFYCFAIVVVFAAPVSYGQTTVWLSDNATFADLDITTVAPPGTTGSFDIWIKTEQASRHNGIGLNLMSMGDAIEFTGAEIVIGTDRFHIWNTIVQPDGTMITNLLAYAGVGLDLGTGIGPGVPVDNDALGAYRFATIQYRIARPGISELQLKVDDFIFGNLEPNTLHLGIDDPISANVPGGTDTVVDGRIQVVPEPGSAFLLDVGGLFLRR